MSGVVCKSVFIRAKYEMVPIWQSSLSVGSIAEYTRCVMDFWPPRSIPVMVC